MEDGHLREVGDGVSLARGLFEQWTEQGTLLVAAPLVCLTRSRSPAVSPDPAGGPQVRSANLQREITTVFATIGDNLKMLCRRLAASQLHYKDYNVPA